MKIVVIGKSGQLAAELNQLLGDEAVFLGRNDVDITDQQALASVLLAHNPDVIINSAAYTAVDKAESEPEEAYKLNASAVINLADICRLNRYFLVHVSTDYVFDGTKGSPYRTDDVIAPQGVYGKSKAEGEKALLDSLPNQSCLLRTAWVYSKYGNNFVKTMLRLMAEKSELKVIDDQIGSPTWAKGLAEACVYAARHRSAGVYHWTDEGVASWYDFALAIQEIGLEKNLLTNKVPIHPIPSSQYPTPAKRPHYSVLDKVSTRKAFADVGLKHWRKQLTDMMSSFQSEKQ